MPCYALTVAMSCPDPGPGLPLGAPGGHQGVRHARIRDRLRGAGQGVPGGRPDQAQTLYDHFEEVPFKPDRFLRIVKKENLSVYWLSRTFSFIVIFRHLIAIST